MLALRVISRSLIFWDDVDTTAEWIDSQIPGVVKSSIDFMKNAARKAMFLGQTDGQELSQINEDEANKETTDFDPQAVRQANAFIIAGACFSLGLRYAGTANRAAASAIFERALWFLELRDNKDVVTLSQRPDTCTLITCLCTSAVSLAMVMSGTGDLDSFRLLRALRWRCDDGTLYGTHMAIGSAIGLLFLGGGKHTLGNAPDDVAMLITAFYPHFPVLSSDNQYHLQALRHLYSLAVHDRILEAVDIDSYEKVCIPIELSLAHSSESLEVSTPYLLANDAQFTELRSKSDRYYPIVINTTHLNTRDKLSTLFVKRKAGHLSYLQDPNALRSLSIQAGSVDGESFVNSINLFSNDAILSSFAKYFCNARCKGTGDFGKSSPGVDCLFERFCNDVAYECMKEEKSEILPLYLNIFRLIESESKHVLSIQNIWDARLLRTYAEKKGKPASEYLATVSLLSRELVSLLSESIDKSFLGHGINEAALASLAGNVDGQSNLPKKSDILECFLVWCQ